MVTRPPQKNEHGLSGTLKIGEVATESGVSIDTLRFYERTGVLDKPQRTASGYRVYDRSVLERLDFIKRAQMLGFTLSEIQEIISEAHAGHSPCRQVRNAVRKRLRQLDERLKEIRRYRNELAKSLAAWDKVGDVEGRICGLIERSSIRSPIWSRTLKGDRQ